MPAYRAMMRVVYQEEWFVVADSDVEAKQKLLTADLADLSELDRLSWALAGPIMIALPITDDNEEEKDDLI